MSYKIYKVLNHDGTPCHGGSGTWDLDGGWMPRIADIEPCKRGYHLCDGDDQLVKWLGPSIWEAEYRGDKIDAEDKIVVSEARLVRKLDTWNDKTARLFACDCAKHVLGIFESQCPGDSRPRAAIEVSRRFAVGAATETELNAACDAARAAAWDAVGAAARATARAAAWDAARDAAWAAACDAARAAAWDAARAAACDAACDAARAAAWDAAWAAAWDATWNAERKWQAERLAGYLSGDLL